MKTKIRGVFEKVPGSGIWWIQYFDAQGRRRREKAGLKSAAGMLYRKRKTEALQGKKLPENLRARVVRFSELATDALEYCKANNLGQQFDGYRIGRLVVEFGNRPAEAPLRTFGAGLRSRNGNRELLTVTSRRFHSYIDWASSTGKSPQILPSCSNADEKTMAASVF
jgi:hypothetical protein